MTNGTCAPCPAGTYSAAEAATECLPCGQGEVSMPGAQRCTRCPKGSKPRKRDGVFVCELCPMGVHSDDSCPQ